MHDEKTLEDKVIQTYVDSYMEAMDIGVGGTTKFGVKITKEYIDNIQNRMQELFRRKKLRRKAERRNK